MGSFDPPWCQDLEMFVWVEGQLRHWDVEKTKGYVIKLLMSDLNVVSSAKRLSELLRSLWGSAVVKMTSG